MPSVWVYQARFEGRPFCLLLPTQAQAWGQVQVQEHGLVPLTQVVWVLRAWEKCPRSYQMLSYDLSLPDLVSSLVT